MVPSVDEDNSTSSICWRKEFTIVMKKNKAPSTAHLQAEGFRFGGNEIKTKWRKLWPNCEREKKSHQNGRKGLSVGCVGNVRKWIVQILWWFFIYCCLLNPVQSLVSHTFTVCWNLYWKTPAPFVLSKTNYNSDHHTYLSYICLR